MIMAYAKLQSATVGWASATTNYFLRGFRMVWYSDFEEICANVFKLSVGGNFEVFIWGVWSKKFEKFEEIS